ncbi:MAG: TIGR01841 family phasin, partial [Pseudomonadota bacterium]
MASKQQPDQFFDFDVTKLMGDFKVPGVDLEALVASQKKNIEALTQANKTAFEGMQALAKRQAELLRQTMEEVTAAGKQMAEPGTAQEKAAKQAEMAKNAFERA